MVNASPEYMSEFNIHADMDTVVCVLSGSLIMRNCFISTKPMLDTVK